MAAIVIDIPDRQVSALTERAEAQLQNTDPEEWGRRFHTWIESHDRTEPLLPDHAISRESIYPDPV